MGLETDAIADRWAIIAKLWSKLDDGTIGVAKRPKGLKPKAGDAFADTYRATVINTPKGAQIVGLFDGNDPGNAIVLWDDSWNADGTFKVPGVDPQVKAISEAFLAAILFHELVHADEHIYAPSVPGNGEHWDIYESEHTVYLEAVASKGLTGAEAEAALKWEEDPYLNGAPRSVFTGKAQADGLTQERPPQNPNH